MSAPTYLLSTGALRARRRSLYLAIAKLTREFDRVTAAIEIRDGAPPEPVRREAQHGTPSGYKAHRGTWKTPPCRECLDANAEANRRRRAKRAADRLPGLTPEGRALAEAIR